MNREALVMAAEIIIDQKPQIKKLRFFVRRNRATTLKQKTVAVEVTSSDNVYIDRILKRGSVRMPKDKKIVWNAYDSADRLLGNNLTIQL